jgi:hypothetical protein
MAGSGGGSSEQFGAGARWRDGATSRGAVTAEIDRRWRMIAKPEGSDRDRMVRVHPASPDPIRGRTILCASTS